MVYCALLILWLPMPYQAKNCRTKVAQFFVGYENFVQWKFVQCCFALAQSNSHKTIVFVGQKQHKCLGVTKTFERDVIFARIKSTLNKKGFLKLYEKKVHRDCSRKNW